MKYAIFPTSSHSYYKLEKDEREMVISPTMFSIYFGVPTESLVCWPNFGKARRRWPLITPPTELIEMNSEIGSSHQ